MTWKKEMFYHYCFRIYYQEQPRKSGHTGTEWNTSTSDLADNVNILGRYIKTIQKNTHRKLSTWFQNVGQNHNLLTANKSSENVQSSSIWKQL
jgi:hypothetical protein